VLLPKENFPLALQYRHVQVHLSPS